MASTSRRAARPVRPDGLPKDGRRLLLIATVAVVLGSFLPWISTALGNISGARGAGLWTFYTAMLGFTGAFLPVRWHRVAAGQAAFMAVVAVALPIWQVIHVYRLVGFGGWLPGMGLVLVLTGGVGAAVAARRLAMMAS